MTLTDIHSALVKIYRADADAVETAHRSTIPSLRTLEWRRHSLTYAKRLRGVAARIEKKLLGDDE